jgi:hypothetical protein
LKFYGESWVRLAVLLSRIGQVAQNPAGISQFRVGELPELCANGSSREFAESH